MADKTKVVRAAATVMLGPSGAPTDVGYTQGGTGITKSYETDPTMADQTRYPLFINVTSEGYEINFKLLEITASNLKYAWGETDSVSAGTLKLGVEADEPTPVEIQVYAKNKDGDYVKFTFYACYLSSPGEMRFSRDEESLIESTFTATFDDGEACIGLFEEDASVTT
jgi:hypothetical protein